MSELVDRCRDVNALPVREDGRYVLYWMTAQRRLHANHALDRAVDRCLALGRPLLVLEALRADYPHASERFHAFVVQGMADNAAAAARAEVRYLPYVEPGIGAGRGLLVALAEHACSVVTDDHPGLFYPRMIEAAGRASPVRLEAVDGVGIAPWRATPQTCKTAYAFRRHLQKTLGPYLEQPPRARPLQRLKEGPAAVVPREILERWPPATAALLAADPDTLAELPVDHDVRAVETRGGPVAGREILKRFLRSRLARYAEERNHPDDDVASGLSPWLHFGHVGAWEVLGAVAGAEDADLVRPRPPAKGARQGWWGMSEGAEAFLDQLVTWRELGLNLCATWPDHASYASLPDWARQTLAVHAADERPALYDLATLEAAETHDDIWNAAQRQLVAEGRMHNYLRMLWGKNLLRWTRTPEEAWEICFHLNDKYALDGRDPNSLTGISWVFGRYDRPWGPEREVFGKVRTMTSDSTRRKLHLQEYLARYGA